MYTLFRQAILVLKLSQNELFKKGVSEPSSSGPVMRDLKAGIMKKVNFFGLFILQNVH